MCGKNILPSYFPSMGGKDFLSGRKISCREERFPVGEKDGLKSGKTRGMPVSDIKIVTLDTDTQT